MAPSPVQKQLVKLLNVSFALSFLLAAACIVSVSGASIPLGVNYGTLGDNLPPPSQVVTLLQSTIISTVKLFSVDPTILNAFANTDIEFVLGIGNDVVKSLSDATFAAQWVKSNVAPYMPATKIKSLAVGNEVLSTSDGTLIYELQFAMQNLHTALQAAGLGSVQVNTPHSLGLLQSSVPPSNGSFAPGAANILRPILAFLNKTGAPFMANAYPFFGYLGNPNSTNLQYAIFNSSIGYTDSTTKLHYSNMFDAQLDAVYSAMAALGYKDIPIVVSETGWPSVGNPYEPGVSMENAQTFMSNLVKHIKSFKGTPLRPNTPVETYIFALFNEDLKPGAESERNFGLFKPDMTPVYDAGIMTDQQNQTSQLSPKGAAQPSPTGAAEKWCVAKSGVSEAQLQAILDWVCQQAGTDCSAIQQNQSCFNPNTAEAHASFAMNSYYQSQGQHDSDCYFNDNGAVVYNNPSYGSCMYTSSATP